MPSYTYVCKDCGERLEVVRSFSDDPLTVCPACEGTLRQVFKPAGIVFKGSGWHIKDYAKSGAGSGPSGGDGGDGGPSAASSSSDSSSSSTDGASSGSSGGDSGSSSSSTATTSASSSGGGD